MTLWDEIQRKLNKEIEEYKNILANGGISDYNNYRDIVGRIEGLRQSKEILHDLLKTYLDEEEL